MRLGVLALAMAFIGTTSAHAQQLPGTKPLETKGDLALQMVEGIDKYLMRELAATPARRTEGDREAKRTRLRQILGIVDRRVPVVELQLVATTTQPALVAEMPTYRIYAVRWPVFAGVDADGLLLEPTGKVQGTVVALPDADQTPEHIAGLVPGVSLGQQFARGLVDKGYRVLVPTLIDRRDNWSGNERLGRFTNQPHREFIYRMAFEMGRHVIGYEVQKVLATVDWVQTQKEQTPVGVAGYGEGGLIALCTAAVEPRIQFTQVGGYFGLTSAPWSEPIYRNVWGLWRDFGDADLANLVRPRVLTHLDRPGPEVKGPPAARQGRSGAAPGGLANPGRERSQPVDDDWTPTGPAPVDRRKDFDPAGRQRRQFQQLVDYSQQLMRDADVRRHESFWSKLDLGSRDKFLASTEPHRKRFYEEVIGKLPAPTEPMNPRARLAYDTPKWKGYEVTLDLYPDVLAYGVLLVPNDLKPGERRAVVVCQHGLEGRPQDVVNPAERTRYYNSFGAQLADRGYIVFAPQNPYIGQDKFRVLQRKANPLGLSLFSFIVRQHERILDWLATLPFVDADKLAFYGLSYGGKTAMRVPALLPRYCLSICSGDFNEWIWKNVSVDFRGSYMFTGEYEMPEFDLGNTFNYAEMAALIAPRPFMVERGHDDGVGIDEWVALEYAKVRRLYAKLGIPDRTEIEFFDGGHVINGKGTFDFLRKHLGWPR